MYTPPPKKKSDRMLGELSTVAVNNHHTQPFTSLRAKWNDLWVNQINDTNLDLSGNDTVDQQGLCGVKGNPSAGQWIWWDMIGEVWNFSQDFRVWWFNAHRLIVLRILGSLSCLSQRLQILLVKGASVLWITVASLPSKLYIEVSSKGECEIL